MNAETSFYGMDEGILIEIFKRVDSKSVGKSRCVCKGWHSTLTSSYFTTQHLQHQPPVELPIVEYYHNGTFTYCTLEIVGKYTAVARELRYPPQKHASLTSYMNSCNGLLLFKKHSLLSDFDAYVVNETTNEKVEVDFSDFRPFDARPNDVILDVHGIGHDHNTNDYHIIAFSNYNLDDYTICEQRKFVCEYSLKNRSWRRINSMVYNCDETVEGNPCYLNGCLYWVIWNGTFKTYTMISLDMGSDNLLRFNLPEKCRFLCESGGSLYVSSSDENSGVEVWMLMENNKFPLWSKVYGLKHPNMYFRKIPLLCLASEENLVLDMGGGIMAVYNLNNKTFRRLVINNNNDGGYMYVGSYRESLVSPNVI